MLHASLGSDHVLTDMEVMTDIEGDKGENIMTAEGIMKENKFC